MRHSRLNKAVSCWNRQRIARLSLHADQLNTAKQTSKGPKDLSRPPTTSRIFQILQYEEDNGFINSRGQSGSFNDVIFKELQRLKEHCPWSLQRELDAINTKYRDYPEWDAGKRRAHVEATKSVMSQTSWIQDDFQKLQVPASRQRNMQANFRQRQTLARFPSMTPARPAAAPQSVSQPSQEPSTKGRPEANGDQDSIIGRGQTPGSLAGDEDQGLAEQPSSDRPASIQEAQAVPEVERGINGAKSPTASDKQRASGVLGADWPADQPSWRQRPAYARLSPFRIPERQQHESFGRFVIGAEDLGLDSKCNSKKHRLVIYDTETNGEWPEQRVIELAAYSVETGQKFSTLINSDCENEVQIMSDAIKVHHITPEELSRPNVPKFREAGVAFMEFLQKQLGDDSDAVIVLAAHNLKRFDHVFVTREFRRQMGSEWDWPDEWLYLDSLPLAKSLYPLESNKQEALLARLGIAKNENAHRALPDTLYCARMVSGLLRERNASIDDLVLDMESGGKYKCVGRLQDLPAEISAGQPRVRSSSPRAPPSAPKKPAEKRATIKPRALPKKADESVPDELIRAFPDDWSTRLSQPVHVRPLLDNPLNVPKSLLTPGQRDKLQHNNFETIEGVLQFYPRLHRDCQLEMQDGEYATLVGTVIKNKTVHRVSMSIMLLEFTVKPGVLASLRGQPHSLGSAEQLVRCEKMSQGRYNTVKHGVGKFMIGDRVIAQGKVKREAGNFWTMDADMMNPWPAEEALPPLIVPIYSKKTTATPEVFKRSVERVLREADKDVYDKSSWDCLPQEVLEEQGLIPWHEAIQQIHFPSSLEKKEEARRHLVFTELYLWQLSLILWGRFRRQAALEAETAAPGIGDHALVEEGIKALPYTLTKAQKRALDSILEDLKGPVPLDGLLQGDVACGKTVVAFLAMFAAVGSGFQAALMAPSQILAEQHFQGLQKLVSNLPAASRPSLALLTSDTKQTERKTLSAALAQGDLQILVGTHALLTENEPFHDLGLAVIDEQHKFGVGQRAALQDKGSPVPHMLSLGATPIPRTLELMQTGHLTSYAIDEMPPGRQKVQTFVLPDTASHIHTMCEYIKVDLASGGRTYFIFPRIESKSVQNLKTVKSEHPKYVESGVLGPDVSIEMIHGQLSASEQNERAKRFKEGETQVLFATSLVEVGLDVPEASTIVIYNASNFGLAQLHQFRGRVGRGARPSRCFLLYSEDDSAAQERLALLEREQNGFKIAEADLEHRGAGNLLGNKQSGNQLSEIPLFEGPEDKVILDQARQAAGATIDRYGLQAADWPSNLLDALSRKVSAGIKANSS